MYFQDGRDDVILRSFKIFARVLDENISFQKICYVIMLDHVLSAVGSSRLCQCILAQGLRGIVG